MHTKTAILHAGLFNAIITASRDETVPMLCAVEISSDGKQLVIASTDRFRLGAARVHLDEGGGVWRFVLKLKDAETLVKSLKTVKRDAEWRSAEIEFVETLVVPTKDKDKTQTANTLNVKLNSGESFRFDEAKGEFPKWRNLLPASGSGTEEHLTGFTAEYLASFARVISESPHLTLRHFGKDRPRVITVGTDYVGLIMPTRHVADEPKWQVPRWLADPKVKASKVKG